MRHVRKIRLFILFFVSGIGTLPAQVPFFKTFQVDKDRSGIRVQHILKDHNGFIWLGTSEGLYHFNGTDFSKINSEFFRDSSVTALFEDSRQRLWVGFRNGKIATVENRTLKLFLPEGRLPKTTVHAIAEGRDSVIWFATNGEGVFYDSKDSLINLTVNDGLSDDFTYSLAAMKDGSMWIGTDQGVSIINLNKTEKKITGLSSSDGLPDNIVRVLLTDEHENVWIGMQDKGVCKYLVHEKSFVTPDPLKNWEFGQVNCLLETENDLWIGTEDHGIVDFEINSGMSVRHLDTGDKGKLTKINDLIEDGEFNVWIANNTRLIRSSGEQISLLSYFEKTGSKDQHEKEKTEFKFIHSVLFDRSGNLWFTPDQGLVKLSVDSKSEKKFTRFTLTPPNALVDITSMYEDKNGYIWIGTMGSGIFRINTANGEYVKIRGNAAIEKASILSIAIMDDELWFAGLEGVTKCSIQQGGSEHAWLKTEDIRDTESFGKNYVYSIFIDSQKRVWFGSDDKGLIMYDHGKFSSYSTANGLLSNVVYSITEDPSGNIWFSTLKSGLYKFDGKSFVNYSTKDGLSDLTIYSIASDKYGNLVIINNQGIDVLDPGTGLITYYDRAVGIDEIVADLNSITRDKYGNIWIGTDAGILKYHPCASKQLRQPVTAITGVSVFLEDVGIEQNTRFSYDQNNLTIAYDGLWYSDPDRVFFQYMLEGYNNAWITSNDRKITYPRLGPGKYTFRVRSSLNENFNRAKEVKYSFVIRPPFWKRWWFVVLLMLVGGIALRQFIINRERRIKHLDRLQKEKIEFQFETLKNQVNPHFLFNSFNTLISIIEESPKVASEYVDRLSQFFRSIVAHREKDVISLNDELELLDNYFFLQKKRYGQNLTLDILVPEEIRNSGYVPPLTLQLLMENAVKHNAVSRETPLHVEIFIDKHGKLVLRNNVNRKRNKEESSGMGLENIISRYKMLSDRTVEIKSGEEFFEVSIPLLKEH